LDDFLIVHPYLTGFPDTAVVLTHLHVTTLPSFELYTVFNEFDLAFFFEAGNYQKRLRADGRLGRPTHHLLSSAHGASMAQSFSVFPTSNMTIFRHWLRVSRLHKL
jgi:hypothetical protein